MESDWCRSQLIMSKIDKSRNSNVSIMLKIWKSKQKIRNVYQCIWAWVGKGKWSILGEIKKWAGGVLLRWLCGIKNLPAMQETQETWLWFLGWTDPLEEENGNLLQYSCLKKIPWTEEHGGLQSKMSQRIPRDWATEQAGKEVGRTIFRSRWITSLVLRHKIFCSLKDRDYTKGVYLLCTSRIIEPLYLLFWPFPGVDGGEDPVYRCRRYKRCGLNP